MHGAKFARIAFHDGGADGDLPIGAHGDDRAFSNAKNGRETNDHNFGLSPCVVMVTEEPDRGWARS